MSNHKHEIELESERSFEVISRYVPEIEEASMLFNAGCDAFFNEDGSWTVTGEINSYDIAELREKVGKSFFVNAVDGEPYHDETVAAFVSIEGTLPQSVTTHKSEPQVVLYSSEQKCGHIEPVKDCLKKNIQMLISNGYAPDFVPVGIVETREQGHNLLDRLERSLS